MEKEIVPTILKYKLSEDPNVEPWYVVYENTKFSENDEENSEENSIAFHADSYKNGVLSVTFSFATLGNEVSVLTGCFDNQSNAISEISKHSFPEMAMCGLNSIKYIFNGIPITITKETTFESVFNHIHATRIARGVIEQEYGLTPYGLNKLQKRKYIKLFNKIYSMALKSLEEEPKNLGKTK